MAQDVRSARAEAKAAKARAKAMRPWYQRKRYWLLAAVAIIIAIAVGASSGSKASTSASNNGGVKTLSANGSHPPQADVSISGCSLDAIGLGNARLAITNHSSGQSDYIVTVAFENASGTQIGTGDSLVQNVDAGQKAVDTATGSLNGSSAGMVCKIKSVDRTASLP